MIGIGLVFIGEFFQELGTSLAKYEFAHKKESLYAIGFLNGLWATLFFILWGVFGGGEFVFSTASLPTFIPRALLEIAMQFVTIQAVITAERSTFTFLRIFTIPLLLVVDLVLLYPIAFEQIVGICIIVAALIILLLNHGLSRRGKMLSLASGVIAVITISLYKYDITHYNSVIAEQTIIHLILLCAMVVTAEVRLKENVFRCLLNPMLLLQSLVAGIAGVLLSVALVFAPASIIMAAKRSFEILGAIVSGRAYFHEKNVALKLFACALIALGLSLIAYFSPLTS